MFDDNVGLLIAVMLIYVMLPSGPEDAAAAQLNKEETMSDLIKGGAQRTRDRKSLYQRVIMFLRLRRLTKASLHQPPRTLAEALHDGGALHIPAGRDRFTGGW